MRQTRSTQWAQLFELPAHSQLPLQAQLRLTVVQAILDGRLASGAAMPSSRELARALNLSRNTVTAAYQQLADEGFLLVRERSGVQVAPRAQHGPLAMPASPLQLLPSGARPQTAPDWEQRVLRSLSAKPTLIKPEQWRDAPYPFVYGRHDPELFPTEDFRECCVRSLARSQLPAWTPDFETEDVPELLQQIRTRLLPPRGVFALDDEVLITVGTQQAFYLLAEALLAPHTRLGFEEPGHPHARHSFALREPQFVSVPVDDQGLVVDALPQVDYVFVTPSHQSPTTATMSLPRREALLQRAAANDMVIIEDDYEAENLYEGAPMPALKSLDKAGRVIYVGSVSKSLSPALRLGYIVASRGLIRELRVLRHAMLRHPSAFLQHAWALFMQLGHHESHARRVNHTMHKRLAQAAQSLQTHLPSFSFDMPQGGASLWVRAPAWVDAAELAAIARQHGVLVEAGDVFFAVPPYPCPHLRLRLSSLPEAQIDAGIRALAAAVAELAQARGHTLPAANPG